MQRHIDCIAPPQPFADVCNIACAWEEAKAFVEATLHSQ